MRQSTETRFWQLLLAAELPFAKSERISQSLRSAGSESEAIERLKSSALISEADARRMNRGSEDLERALGLGARILTAESLPEGVAHALPGLAGVWSIGDEGALSRPRVAIVGTRGATAYGKACAIKFAEALARAGATIVSGGAFGIDAAAHRGALDSGGATVAVMPSGVDVAYPASHRSLFAEIRERGLQVSQFACGMQPRHDTFLTRNMLIAALSDAVLIIEAPEASGALHTANRAADFGRQVYVVPASITHGSFRGSHALIRSGATLVDHPDQILEDLDLCAIAATTDGASRSEAQQRILDALSTEPTSSEKVAERAELDPAVAMGELTMLELDGLVIRSAGGFVLKP